MQYTLFYTVPEKSGMWGVESEEYEGIDAPDPIAGTKTTVASGLPTKDRADTVARRHQVRSYAVNVVKEKERESDG